MRKVTFIWPALVAIAVFAAQAAAEEAPAFQTQKDRDSYALGVNIERNFKLDGVDVNLEALIRGMKDAQAEKTLMTDDELLATLKTFASVMQEKQAKAWQAAAQDNKKRGDEFLAGNKTKEGVVTLTSGLQYKVIKAGNGRKPIGSETVECKFRGRLIDGTEFGNSERAGGSVSLQVSNVIPGWQEALKLMTAGSEWQLFVPPELGYGQKGAGPIGPNETLIFDIALVSVK